MRHAPLAAAILLATACSADDSSPFDAENADELFDQTQIVGELGYGHTAKADFLAQGFAGYTFEAEAGDVVSLFAHGAAAGSNPLVVIYEAGGGGEPLARMGLGDEPNAINAHIRELKIPKAGKYLAVIAERGGVAGSYRLRLACDGGPCAPKFAAPRTGVATCESSPLGQLIRTAVETSDLDDNPIPLDTLFSTRNVIGPVLLTPSIEIFGDDRAYPMIFPGLADQIAQARFEVDMRYHRVAASSDPIQEVLDGIQRLETRLQAEGRHGDPVIVRLISDGSELGDAKSIVQAFVDRKFDPELIEWHVARHTRAFVGEDHAKVNIIDGAIVHIAGANASGNNNYDRNEHDTGYLFRGDVAKPVLADFDFAWNHGSADETTCDVDAKGKVTNCKTFKSPAIEHRAEVLKPDLDSYGVPASACLPLIYTTNKGTGNLLSTDDDHAVAVAYESAIRNAREVVRLESPNLNDNLIIDAVIDALEDNGIRAQITIPQFRNELLETLPFGGGDNTGHREAMEMRLDADDMAGRFQYRWHPIPGDGKGAQHTKYASFDHQVAIVGSTNLDTQSINRAREVNIVIDDAEITQLIDSQVFVPDFKLSEVNSVFDDGFVE